MHVCAGIDQVTYYISVSSESGMVERRAVDLVSMIDIRTLGDQTIQPLFCRAFCTCEDKVGVNMMVCGLCWDGMVW